MAEKEPRPALIRFKRLSQEARLPAYAHQGDAGFDIATTEERTLSPGDWYAFSTGLASEFPHGFYVEVRDRSGHAHKHGLHVLGGTIDSGFRGEWQVILPVAQAKIEEAERLSQTERGTGGLGSSGRK